MHLLTGEDANYPYFGKLLYLYLAKGRDQIKITMMRFFEGLAPFAYEENKQMQQKLCFSILDLDQDGLLNILNLLHLNDNFHFMSRIG
jgi:hypothetical protein